MAQTRNNLVDSPHIELMRRLVTSLADATPSPRVGRSLAGLMRQAGLENINRHAVVINVPLSMARIAFGGHVDKCVQQGLLSASAGAQWWQQLEEANATGDFYWGAVVFTAIGEKR